MRGVASLVAMLFFALRHNVPIPPDKVRTVVGSGVRAKGVVAPSEGSVIP